MVVLILRVVLYIITFFALRYMPNKKRKGFRRTAAKTNNDKGKNRSAVRKQWSEEQMLAAIEDVADGVPQNRAADLHGVPRTTLKDRVSGRVLHGTKPGPIPYLSSNEESELASFLIDAAKIGYGRTRRDVRCLVESHLQQNCGMDEIFSVSNGWWNNFMKRNPSLRLRQGDSTANVRMDALNQENITAYFDLLKGLYDEYDFHIHPEAIYNMDESGVPLEPRPPKVIAKKGQKKVRYRTSGTKAQITILGCGSATGQIIPPFIIFAAKQVNPLWTANEVSGSRYAVSDKGWVDQELFKFWLKEHFLANAVGHRPLLLLLDGHSSHFEPSTIEFAKENEVVICCLPPHTTHECQPLDVSVFGSLKTHWREQCHKFYRKNPGRVINKLNFNSVFRQAWLSAVTPSNICGGFRRAGVFPFNPDAIQTTPTGKFC